MKRKKLTVSRIGGASTSPDGTVIPTTPTTFEIRASVQPADKRQLEALPFLRDFQQFYTLFSDNSMNTSQASKTQADSVSIVGVDYECVTCEQWQNGIRSHYKILVGR